MKLFNNYLYYVCNIMNEFINVCFNLFIAYIVIFYILPCILALILHCICPSFIITSIEKQNNSGLTDEQWNAKWNRMKASAFDIYRGGYRNQIGKTPDTTFGMSDTDVSRYCDKYKL